MTAITFAVDGPEWDSLYENPENENSPHRIHEGSSVEAQLVLWPKLILHHWNKRNSNNQLAYLGFDPEKPFAERSLVSLKAGSNLYLVSGIARQIVRRPWKTDSRKHRIDILLDCGLPLVICEDVKKSDQSTYVEKEGEFLAAICLLFGSITFSGVMIRTPIVGRVTKITPLRVVPPATILEIQLQPNQVVPESRIDYYGEKVKTVDCLDPTKA
jgi:hypothetical protein